MGVWQLIRLIFLLVLIGLNIFIGVLTYIANKRGCSRNWKSQYLIYSSIAITINALINIAIPFNKFMANFFLVGSIYATTILLAVIIQLYCLYSYADVIEKCKKTSAITQNVFQTVKVIGIAGYVGITLGIVLMLIYS